MSPFKLIPLAMCVFTFTIFAASSVESTPTDTSFISDAVGNACNELLKVESQELFFDMEECDYAISKKLVDGHLESDLQNREYLAVAIATGYRKLLLQYQNSHNND